MCSNLRKNVLSGSVWSLRRTWINDRGTVKAYNWFLFEQDFQKSQPSKKVPKCGQLRQKQPDEHSTSPYSSRVWGFVKHAQTNQVNHRRLISSWSQFGLFHLYCRNISSAIGAKVTQTPHHSNLRRHVCECIHKTFVNMYDTHIWVKYVICFCLVHFSFYNMPFLNPLSTQSYRLTSSYSLK